MTLRDIQAMIEERGAMSLQEIQVVSELPLDVLRERLNRLVAKGRLSVEKRTGTCGGCSQCDPIWLEIYQVV